MNKSGIKWGSFTLRIPFIHTKLLTAEFLQGLVISGATALAAAPVGTQVVTPVALAGDIEEEIGEETVVDLVLLELQEEAL